MHVHRPALHFFVRRVLGCLERSDWPQALGGPLVRRRGDWVAHGGVWPHHRLVAGGACPGWRHELHAPHHTVDGMAKCSHVGLLLHTHTHAMLLLHFVAVLVLVVVALILFADSSFSACPNAPALMFLL